MKQYSLEWSKMENSFRTQPIEIMLAGNQECFLKDTSHDWIVVMVGTRDVLANMADHHQDRLKDRAGVAA